MNVKMPIAVELDLEARAAYVRYSTAPVDRTIAVLPSAIVAADLDRDGDVVGIELLRIDDAAVVFLAKHFAAQRELAFPPHVDGRSLEGP